MSDECTSPSLVSISSSTSPLSVKLCPICVHQSILELEFYGIISRQMPISYARGIPLEGRMSLSFKCTLPTLVSISSSPSALSVKLCPMCVHRSVQEFEFYRIINRIMPICRGILWRAVRLCPSNAHLQLWCLSAPLHHLCLLNFVQCVCIDPFKS